MGLFKKGKRFFTVLALVAALSSACKKELEPADHRLLKSRIDRVTAALQKGEPDQEANRELVRLINQFKKEGYKLKGVGLPKGFDDCTKYLDDFYKGIEVFKARLREKQPLIFLASPSQVLKALQMVKSTLGFVPEDEKRELIKVIEEIISILNEMNQNIGRYPKEANMLIKRYLPIWEVALRDAGRL